MVQTRKTYKQISSREFQEDLNGFIIGFEWTDEFSIKRRVLYLSSLDKLTEEFTSADGILEFYDPKFEKWELTKSFSFKATMDSYLNPLTGETSSTNLDSNGDIMPQFIEEFRFFYTQQLQLFNPMLQSMQVRKFGATGFN